MNNAHPTTMMMYSITSGQAWTSIATVGMTILTLLEHVQIQLAITARLDRQRALSTNLLSTVTSSVVLEKDKLSSKLHDHQLKISIWASKASVSSVAMD